VLAAAFSQAVTLWDQESHLRTSLAKPGDESPIVSLQFGNKAASRLLITVTDSHLTTWDLLTLSVTWSLPLPTTSPLLLAACPASSHLAVVHKNLILILDPSSHSVLARLPDVNCTGAAVFGRNSAYSPNDPSQPQTCLYFMNYSGIMKRVGPKVRQSRPESRVVEQWSALKSLLKPQRKEKREEVEQWSRAGSNQDIEAMLALPLHAVPSTSCLQNTLVRNRVLALPKLRLPVSTSTSSCDSDQFKQLVQSRKVEKYEDVFKFKLELTPEQDLKSFCKLLKNKKM